MIKFTEYLNGQGKLVEKPTVDPKADYKGKVPAKPEQGSGTEPYAAGRPVKKPKTTVGPSPDKGGFAEKGDKKLEYKPDTKVPAKVGEGGDKKPTWPNGKVKTCVETLLDDTKDMSAAEFARYVASQNKVENNGVAHPIRYIKYVAQLIAENNNLATTLVHELRRHDLLPLVVFETLQSAHGVQAVVEMMSDAVVGPGFCRKLAKKMAEEVAPPVAGDDADPAAQDIPTDPAGDNPTPTAPDEDAELDPNAPPPEDMPVNPDGTPGDGTEGAEEPEVEIDPDAPGHEEHDSIRHPDAMVHRLQALKGQAPAAEHFVAALTGHPRLLEHLVVTADRKLRG
jgi:hypothetical protein